MSKYKNVMAEIMGKTETVHRDGIAWYEAKPPSLLHKCQAQTTGFIGFTEMQRCACGAIWDTTYRNWIYKNQRRANSGNPLVAGLIAGAIALIALVAVFMLF